MMHKGITTRIYLSILAGSKQDVCDEIGPTAHLPHLSVRDQRADPTAVGLSCRQPIRTG